MPRSRTATAIPFEHLNTADDTGIKTYRLNIQSNQSLQRASARPSLVRSQRRQIVIGFNLGKAKDEVLISLMPNIYFPRPESAVEPYVSGDTATRQIDIAVSHSAHLDPGNNLAEGSTLHETFQEALSRRPNHVPFMTRFDSNSNILGSLEELEAVVLSFAELYSQPESGDSWLRHVVIKDKAKEDHRSSYQDAPFFKKYEGRVPGDYVHCPRMIDVCDPSTAIMFMDSAGELKGGSDISFIISGEDGDRLTLQHRNVTEDSPAVSALLKELRDKETHNELKKSVAEVVEGGQRAREDLYAEQGTFTTANEIRREWANDPSRRVITFLEESPFSVPVSTLVDILHGLQLAYARIVQEKAFSVARLLGERDDGIRVKFT